jgi:glycerate kinase
MTRAAPVIVVAPDSFKGSLAAPAICESIRDGLRRVWAHADVRACPMADGGEGTLDAVLSATGPAASRLSQRVSGADGTARNVAYGVLDRPEGRTAVVEVAQIVGITDEAAMRTPVLDRTTTGLGELLRSLLDGGITRFMIGLGGSSTNDGGAGMLQALGVRLAKRDGSVVAPTPRGLADLDVVDAGDLDARLAQAHITIMSDVSNPLCGPRGATAVFGPQKGVAAHDVEAIDATLAGFARAVERALDRSIADAPGAGAAGGLGFALQLVGARFESGAGIVAELVGLDAALHGADWAIAGEGRSDMQTLLGKAPLVVARRAARAGVPVSLLSGSIDDAALPAFAAHFAGCFALPAGPASLASCIADAPRLLADRAEQMGRLFDAARME